MTTKTIVCLVICGVCGALAAYGGVQSSTRMSFGAYRPVPATVISSQLDKSVNRTRIRRRTYIKDTIYKLQVTFQYTTPDQTGTSSKWSIFEDVHQLPGGLNEDQRAQQLAAKYQTGQTFTAYQSMTNPSMVVATNPSTGAGVYALLTGAGIAGIVGSLLYLILSRKSASPRTQWE